VSIRLLSCQVPRVALVWLMTGCRQRDSRWLQRSSVQLKIP